MNLSELIAAGASEAEINKQLKDALDGFARELEWVFAKRSADANRPNSPQTLRRKPEERR